MKNLKTEPIGIIVLILAVLFGAAVLRANEMFLVEDYIEGDMDLDTYATDTTVASISFTLDRQAFVTITIGGIFKYLTDGPFAIYGCSWITMNGEKLRFSIGSPEISGSYIFALDPGNYEFELKGAPYPDGRIHSLIHHPRIQALIILSDTITNHALEKPPERGDPIQASLITSGLSINVPGCIEVRDITGRTVKNCEISGDRVMLSTLSRGTYFLERENGRSVKLVKM